jgi:8-oxo-dGTP diphosphatase
MVMMTNRTRRPWVSHAKLDRQPSVDELAYLEEYEELRHNPEWWRGVTVDIVVLTFLPEVGELAVLLVQRGEHPFKGLWALPGGFVRRHEDIEDAARRELTEETLVRPKDAFLHQLRAYGMPERDPRGRIISIAYLALVPQRSLPPPGPRPGPGADTTAARFFRRVELARVIGRDGLAFDHGRIVNDGVEKAREELELTSVATSFVDEPFTLFDLRRVYEAVWGIKLDPANFRRKVTQTENFLRPTGTRRAPAHGGRPAELFELVQRGKHQPMRLHPPIRRP